MTIEQRVGHHGAPGTNALLSPEAGLVITDVFKNRWRTLMSVDDVIAAVIAEVETLGLSDSTYFFYSSGWWPAALFLLVCVEIVIDRSLTVAPRQHRTDQPMPSLLSQRPRLPGARPSAPAIRPMPLAMHPHTAVQWPFRLQCGRLSQPVLCGRFAAGSVQHSDGQAAGLRLGYTDPSADAWAGHCKGRHMGVARNSG